MFVVMTSRRDPELDDALRTGHYIACGRYNPEEEEGYMPDDLPSVDINDL